MARFPQSQPALALTKEGDQFYYAGRRGEAVDRYNKVLQLEPDCVYILVQLGMALQESEFLTDAISNYERAIQLDPSYGMAYYGRGWARHWKGDYQGELEDARLGYKLDPENPLHYLRRTGAALTGLNQPQEALKIYGEILHHAPNDQGTLLNRASAFTQMGMYPEAIQDLNHVLQLDPDWTWALARRAYAYKKLKQFDKALADVELALKYDPAYAEGQRIKADILREMQAQPTVPQKQGKGFLQNIFGKK